MDHRIMKPFNKNFRHWILVALALLILLTLTVQPCLAGLIWSG